MILTLLGIVPYRIKTSQLICIATQLTNFFRIETMILNLLGAYFQSEGNGFSYDNDYKRDIKPS